MAHQDDFQREALPGLTVVIPAFNEYPGILKVLDDLRHVAAVVKERGLCEGVTLIVVNDGSRDQTGEAVAAESDVTLISFPSNRGYGAALKAGFAAATTEYLCFLDADGTYPPSALPDLLATIKTENADIVIGSRLSGAPSEMPLVRYWGNRIFARLTSWVSGRSVSDCASGMRVFKRSVLPRLYPLPDGLDFTPAMTTRAILEGLHYVEKAIPYRERVGHSKLNALNDGIRFFKSIIRMTTFYNPFKFFGLIGFFLAVLGFAYGLEPVYHYLTQREVPGWFIYRLLATLTFWLAGLQIITLGILANVTLALIHRQISQRSRVITFILQKKLLFPLDVIAVVFIGGALVLNWHNLMEYVSSGQVSGHWSYLVSGAFLVLTGIQMGTVSIMIRILYELKLRDDYIARDLGNRQ